MSLPTVTAARIFKGQFFSESGTMEAGAYTRGRPKWGQGPFLMSPSPPLQKNLYLHTEWKYFRQHISCSPKTQR